MTYQTQTTNRLKTGLAGIIATPVVRTVALLALCAAYIQGPLTKIFDFNGAMAEMNHFGLHPAAVFAVVVIVFELTASAMVVSGAADLPSGWNKSGFAVNEKMIADFAEELYEQKILPRRLSPAELFPKFA